MKDQVPKVESLADTERGLLLSIIDLLASEYGWTIEYIQQLEMPEVGGLLRAILDRQDRQDILDQVNIAKGFNGKVGSNRTTKKSKKAVVDPKVEVDNLRQLANMLKIPIKQEEKK